MYRRDLSPGFFCPDLYGNNVTSSWNNRDYSEIFVTHNQSHWYAGQDTSCPFCNDRRQSQPIWNTATKEACDSSTDVLGLGESNENQNIATNASIPDDDLRHFLNRRRNVSPNQGISTISEASNSFLDHPQHRPVLFNLSENVSHPSVSRPKHKPISFNLSTKTASFPKHKPISFNSSNENISKNLAPPKHKPITFNNSPENLSEATTTTIPPKHKPITFKSSNKNVSHVSHTLDPPKHAPITLNFSTGNPSEDTNSPTTPKHKNVSCAIKTLNHPKENPISFMSSDETNPESTMNLLTPLKRRAMRFNLSTKNYFKTEKTIVPALHQPMTRNLSTENVCEAAKNLTSTSVNIDVFQESNIVPKARSPKRNYTSKLVNATKLVIRKDAQSKEAPTHVAKDPEMNEMCQSFQTVSNITQAMLSRSPGSSQSICSTPRTMASDAEGVLSLDFSPYVPQTQIDQTNGMEGISILEESNLSQMESTGCDVRAHRGQFNLSSSLEEPSSSFQIRNSVPVRSVLEALSCGECKKWAHSGRVYWCECRIICRSCRKKTDSEICSLCETIYVADARLVNFHQRLASTVPHPCRYRFCTQLVKPGAAHEETCQYVPTKCFICYESIPTAFLRLHFDDAHPNQVFSNRNYDVKFSDFIKVEMDGKRREIFCFTHGMLIPITLNKIGDERSFIVTAPNFNATPSNITVTFEFVGENSSYVFKKKVTVRNDLVAGLDTVDLPCDIFWDWTTGKSKLNINLVVKRRRMMENRSTTKKQRSMTEKIDQN